MALVLARLVRLVVGLIVLVIVVGGLLFLLSANPSNAIVRDIHDAASTLVGPFKNLFSFSGHPKATLAVNWGLAAVVYLVVGGFISRMLARMGTRRVRRTRPVITS
jgi:hypothetical protein